MLRKIRMMYLTCDHVTVQADGTEKACDQFMYLPTLDGKEIRARGWAYNHEGKCYCADHAPFHRNPGRNGGTRKFVQLKMEVPDGK